MLAQDAKQDDIWQDTTVDFAQYTHALNIPTIYPRIIETVKDWADCEQLTPIEVGQIFVKI